MSNKTGRPAIKWLVRDLKLVKKYIKNRDENRSIKAILQKIYGYQTFNRKVKEIKDGQQ